MAEGCPHRIIVPMHFDGTFQQYVTLPLSFLQPLPDWVFRGGLNSPSPSAYTAALCSGSAALKAVQAACLLDSDVVLVIGIAGAIGHLCGLIAGHVFGAKVIGVDLAAKLEAVLAHDMRICDEIIAAPETDDPVSMRKFQEVLMAACTRLRCSSYGLRLPDAVVSAANAGTGFVGCENYVREGGTIVWTG